MVQKVSLSAYSFTVLVGFEDPLRKGSILKGQDTYTVSWSRAAQDTAWVLQHIHNALQST